VRSTFTFCIVLRIFSSNKKKTDGSGGSPLERSRQEDLPKIYSRNMTRYIYSVVYFESDHKCPYTRSTHKKPISHTGTYTKRKKAKVTENTLTKISCIDYELNYTVSQKKQDTKLLAITSLTIIRFSKFFQ